MKTLICWIAIVCTTLSVNASERGSVEGNRVAESRVWESRSGQHARASLLAQEGDRLIFEDASGKKLKAKAAELSAGDLSVAMKWLVQRRGGDPSATTLVSLLQGETPLQAIENSLDLLDQVSGVQLASALQGQRVQPVMRTYAVQVPVVREVTEFVERWERRCIRGRWVCVRVLIPVRRQIQEYRQEQRTRSETVVDENFVAILEALQTYTSPPTTEEERGQIKRLLLQAYAILANRQNE
ncbi:hypothetical protein [Novipirellula sp.]|uniref:hypothetical protein n=1 Tax=Novipirellula sp. TaxID=2795430 RepID=UPI00356718CB